MTTEKTGETKPAWLLQSAIIFFIVVLLLALAGLIFELSYRNKIYPGLYLGDTALGGLPVGRFKEILNHRINQLNQQGITFLYGDKQYAILPTIASTDADLAYNLMSFDVDKTVAGVLAVGRNGNFWSDLKDKIGLLAFGGEASVAANLDRAEIKKILDSAFAQYNEPAQDAKLIYSDTRNRFSVTEEKTGRILDTERAIEQLASNLKRLQTGDISLERIVQIPTIKKGDVLNIDPLAKVYLGLAPIRFVATSSSGQSLAWPVDRNELAAWLALKANGNPTNDEDRVIIGLDSEAVANFMTDKIAPDVERPPAEPKFEIKDGKVIAFSSGQTGYKIDRAATLARLDEEFISGKQTKIALAIEEVAAKKYQAGEDFGIKEIIGTGQSNFSGSPKNRRHNIKVGADSLNGVLIKPGEKFSLIKALGDISSSTGYRPELVIKGNRTVPEFGGGLCQIGTTMFRGALDSGLPINERRNHSYRVVYYEPAGTDATIYDPAPDFKFTNDTGNYVLIQSRIEKDDLFFDFWGTRDGRVATRTKPVISNIVKPGPTKIIETTDLKPGEKKCTEKPHNGADAYFDYRVVYGDGRNEEKRFYSHYIPWQEVCLLGVEKPNASPSGADLPAGEADSTPSNVSSSTTAD